MKKVLIVFLSLIIFIPNCFALVNTANRGDYADYGVHKKWQITNKNKSNVLKTPLVDANEKIYDFSNVLKDDEKEELLLKIQEFYEKTGYEIIILIDNLAYNNDKQNEDYAADFYDYNDFGINDKNYSGILLFRNTYEDDPYYDMYMFGDMQLYYNEQRCDDVLDSIYADIHSQNYLAGFMEFINKVNNYYDSGIPSDMNGYYISENGKPIKAYNVPYFIMIVISFIVTLITMLILKSNNKTIVKATTAFPYIKKIDYKIKNDNLTNSHISRVLRSSSSSSSGGSFHSSSGSSGGFHSSGGGRHG